MADVEQAAEQQLFGVLHVGVVVRARLQTPEDRSDRNQLDLKLYRTPSSTAAKTLTLNPFL